MKIIEKIIDITTNQETIVERDETIEEQKARENKEIERKLEEAELAAKAQARQALLDKLGITEDEAKLLLGGN